MASKDFTKKQEDEHRDRIFRALGELEGWRKRMVSEYMLEADEITAVIESFNAIHDCCAAQQEEEED